MSRIIRIATRKSPLALWQANFVRDQLLQHHPDLIIELLPMVTQGDIILDTPLAKIGGKGLFVKQLETALLEKQADLAVHSMKDVPAEFPAGLGLVTICQRDDPRDAFVSNHYTSLDQLPAGSVVGTSSLRRQCQLRAKRPDLIIKDLRGNVGTRLTKLDQGEYDAIILAVAGLTRLNLAQRITCALSTEQSLPAVGQGAVGIEARLDDQHLHQLLAPLDDYQTRVCVTAERAMNARLQGGCQVPIGCYAQLNDHQLTLRALVGTLDGSQIIYQQLEGDSNDAQLLGTRLAEQLIHQGAAEILQSIYQDN